MTFASARSVATEPLSTGRQPITAYRCAACGMVSETGWEAGRHRDRNELDEWCHGEAVVFYLLSLDEYLDVLLARGLVEPQGKGSP